MSITVLLLIPQRGFVGCYWNPSFIVFLLKNVLDVENSSHFLNNLGQWQGRKKPNQKKGFPPWLDWVSLVHLLSSAVGALVWFQILFTLFYFLSPPSLPREWSKLRSTQPWKRKGLFGGVIQSIVCSTSALVLYFFFRLLLCEQSELQLLSPI